MMSCTTTLVRPSYPSSSLVKRFPPLRPQKMKNYKYRLIFDHTNQTYNGGMKFDIEDSAFSAPSNSSTVIHELAKHLGRVSKAIVRVYCFPAAGATGPTYPYCSTTGFYIDAYHLLTTSDLLEDENGNLVSPDTLSFMFTPRISTVEWHRVLPTLVKASYVYNTNNLLLLRVPPLPNPVPPLLPNKKFMADTKFDPNRCDPDYVNATSICVVGYCGGITLPEVLEDYSNIDPKLKAGILAPTKDDVLSFPTEHKALFPGRIIYFVEGDPDHFCITASIHHGCCGSPVFCPADPTTFIGVVIAGSEVSNFNIILSVLSPEFDEILSKIE
jgi:hypothetical protein